MKWHISILTVIILAVSTLIGCSKSKQIDTAALEKSFGSAEAALKSSVEKAATAIKNADYKPALAELTKLAANAKLTDEQKKAVSDLLERVQKILSEEAAKAAGEASKKVGDLQKTLPK